MAGTTITTGFLTSAGTVRGGDVNLSAKGDILTSTIRSFSDINGGAVSVVSTEGNIDTTNDSEYGNDGYISSYGISRVGGSVTMSAYGNIVTRDIHTDGEVHGGNVKLSAKGDIFTSYISTTSHGIGGNVSLVSTGGKINTINGDGGYISTYGVNGNGGSVTLTADGDITTSYVHAESYSAGGKGGNIKLISQSGGIDTKGGSIFSYANDGNAGFVTLSAKKDAMVGDILSISKASGAVVGNGGKVTIDSGNNIETGNITTTSIIGNAGSVTLKAGGDIKTKAIASNTFAGSGNGGNISLTSDRGNIQIDYARSDSASGKSGNITLDANKRFVKVTGSIDIEGRPTSIYSGEYKKGSITIKHGGGSQLIPFIVGDSSVNGTFAEIQGKEGIASKSILPESFSWKQISIITDSSLLADAFASANNAFAPLSSASSVVTFPSSIPFGVSIDNNIRTAIENRFVFGIGDVGVWNPFWFYNKVKKGSDWDYKKLNPDFRVYEDFGNFNYGATGRAFGFSEHTLLQEAGIAQRKDNPTVTYPGNPGTRGNPFEPGTPPYGDDPNDQYWIQEGIKYYDLIYAPSQANVFKRQFEVFPTDYNFKLF